jgi:hypothetical protein
VWENLLLDLGDDIIEESGREKGPLKAPSDAASTTKSQCADNFGHFDPQNMQTWHWYVFEPS